MEPQNIESQLPEKLRVWIQHLKLDFNTDDAQSAPLIYDVLLTHSSKDNKVIMNERLKDLIMFIEQKIISITGSSIDGSDKWLKNKRKKTKVYKLLRERQRILNLNFIPETRNMERLKELNNYLLNLTQRLYHRVQEAQSKIKILMDNPDFDDDCEVEGILRFCFNNETSVLKLWDVELLGSNFTLMIKLISDLTNGTPKENIEEFYHFSQLLDDGESWNEYPFDRSPAFRNIIISHAVHQLTNHQLYSIPDLLRLNDFWAEVKLTIQSITDQQGNRWKPSTIMEK